jgi:hypothetical protein
VADRWSRTAAFTPKGPAQRRVVGSIVQSRKGIGVVARGRAGQRRSRQVTGLQESRRVVHRSTTNDEREKGNHRRGAIHQRPRWSHQQRVVAVTRAKGRVTAQHVSNVRGRGPGVFARARPPASDQEDHRCMLEVAVVVVRKSERYRSQHETQRPTGGHAG